MAVTHFSGPVAVGSGKVELITAAKTLDSRDNGKTFLMGAAGGFTVTLPAVTSTGFEVRFIVTAAFADTNWIVASAEGDNVEGSLVVAGAVVDVDAADQLNFVASAENVGDFAEVISDGTSWVVLASGALTSGAITATG